MWRREWIEEEEEEEEGVWKKQRIFIIVGLGPKL